MSIEFQRATWRYIPEDITPHNQRCRTLNPLSKVFLAGEVATYKKIKEKY
jgi:hypothetical protein